MGQCDSLIWSCGTLPFYLGRLQQKDCQSDSLYQLWLPGHSIDTVRQLELIVIAAQGVASASAVRNTLRQNFLLSQTWVQRVALHSFPCGTEGSTPPSGLAEGWLAWNKRQGCDWFKHLHSLLLWLKEGAYCNCMFLRAAAKD